MANKKPQRAPIHSISNGNKKLLQSQKLWMNSLLQRQQQLQQARAIVQNEPQLITEILAFHSEVEAMCGLPSGSLGKTHHIVDGVVRELEITGESEGGASASE